MTRGFRVILILLPVSIALIGVLLLAVVRQLCRDIENAMMSVSVWLAEWANSAKAIEARTAETVKQGSAHRAKARSATPICPKTTAITSKDAAA